MTAARRYTSPVLAGARFVAQRLLLRPLVWRLLRVTVLGSDHLVGLERPFVVVANHSSHLDAPLVMGALPRPLARYLAANAAADYFFEVWWRKPLTTLFFNAFPVERRGIRGQPSIATALLDARVPLLIFPEGGRSRTGQLGTFKPGAAALCVSQDVPCLPAAIVGAADAMPYGQRWPNRGRPRVEVIFGQPLQAEDGETATSFNRRIAKEVVRLLDERRAGDLDQGAKMTP